MMKKNTGAEISSCLTSWPVPIFASEKLRFAQFLDQHQIGEDLNRRWGQPARVENYDLDNVQNTVSHLK
jgi:hypothetical protein